MIRFVATASLLALLVLVTYLASAYPPQHFIDHLRMEHELNTAFWGDDHATHILERMLDFESTSKQVSPVPPMTDARQTNAVDNPVANEMSQVNRRLFNNAYFRSIDSLLALAIYRFSALIEWLPILLVFMAAILFDGLLVRIVKSKEFLQHNPEIYALHACAAIVTGCATVIAFVLPVTLHPLFLSIVPMAVSVFVSRALANFHRRG